MAATLRRQIEPVARRVRRYRDQSARTLKFAGGIADGGPVARFVSFLSALLVIGGLTACGSDDSAPAGDGVSPGPPDGTRAAAVRIYQGGNWTAPGETPDTVGAALAQLKPTYVSSLVRLKNGEPITDQEVADNETVQNAVLAANPNAKFSLELNAVEYKTAADVEQMMNTARERFHPDGWFFDFYTTAAEKNEGVMEAAIKNAHENGEFLGGNAFGISNHPTIPPGTDFVAVQDTKFKIDMAAVRELAKRLPVGFHLANAPELFDSDGCVFIQKYSTEERSAYIKMRAGQQKANHFDFAYPVLFPECERKSNSDDPGVYVYNAAKDEPVLEQIGQLMDRYDGSSE
jgi:hypothetical protein